MVLGEGPTQGLDDTTLIVDAKYPINFTQSGKKIVLSLHYNGSSSFLFGNATKIYQITAKNSEIENYALCLGNISKDFTIDNMKKKFNSIDFNPTDTKNIVGIHKYLMKRT